MPQAWNSARQRRAPGSGGEGGCGNTSAWMDELEVERVPRPSQRTLAGAVSFISARGRSAGRPIGGGGASRRSLSAAPQLFPGEGTEGCPEPVPASARRSRSVDRQQAWWRLTGGGRGNNTPATGRTASTWVDPVEAECTFQPRTNPAKQTLYLSTNAFERLARPSLGSGAAPEESLLDEGVLPAAPLPVSKGGGKAKPKVKWELVLKRMNEKNEALRRKRAAKEKEVMNKLRGIVSTGPKPKKTPEQEAQELAAAQALVPEFLRRMEEDQLKRKEKIVQGPTPEEMGCTFRPKISDQASKLTRKDFQKLYEEGKKKLEDRREGKLLKTDEDAQKALCPFKPDVPRTKEAHSQLTFLKNPDTFADWLKAYNERRERALKESAKKSGKKHDGAASPNAHAKKQPGSPSQAAPEEGGEAEEQEEVFTYRPRINGVPQYLHAIAESMALARCTSRRDASPRKMDHTFGYS